MKILFLDDEQIRHERFKQYCKNRPGNLTITFVNRSYDAITCLQQEVFDEIWLDHDLGDPIDTGMHVINFLVDHLEHKQRHGEIIIHSLNPICSKEMRLRLMDAGYRVGRAVPP